MTLPRIIFLSMVLPIIGLTTSDAALGETTRQAGITVLGAAPTTVDNAVLFAFDDVSIPFTSNLKLTMYPAKKHPSNPLISSGKPGTPDEWSVQCYGSVIHHDEKYKLWYIALDKDSFDNLLPGSKTDSFYGARIAYAESKDGIHWTRPNLGLVDYGGNKNNNLVLVDPPGAHGLDLRVLYEPEDPDPSKRFKLMLCMGGRFEDRPSASSIPLYSADGLRWRVATDAKLEDYTVHSHETVLPTEHFEIGAVYKWNEMYHMTGQQVDPWMWLPEGEPCGRVLTTYRSADFVNWSRTRTLSFARAGTKKYAAPLGVDVGEEVHQNSVWHRDNMLLSVYGLWNGAKQHKDITIDLGLLISNDGLHFREPVDDFVFIRRGEDGQWDDGGLLMSQAFENIGDETYIYYGQWDPRVGYEYTRRGGFGVATLERDRFGSLSIKNREKSASFVTYALKVDGTAQLYANVTGLSSDAWLRVELLDELERPLLDYSGDNASRISASGFRQKVTWKGVDGIDNLSKPLKIKVRFEGKKKEDIKLYALYLSNENLTDEDN